MKNSYKLRMSNYKEGSTYALLKISMVQHCLMKGVTDLVCTDDGVEWHDLNDGMWCWYATNNSLDVNEPVDERYDLFIVENEDSHPVLAASIVKDKKTGKYEGYLYDQNNELLKRVRSFEENELEDAKNTLRVLVAVTPSSDKGE